MLWDDGSAHIEIPRNDIFLVEDASVNLSSSPEVRGTSPFSRLPGIGDSSLPVDSFVMDLSRKLIIPEIDLISWPSVQSIPLRYRNLVAQQQSSDLGSSLVVDHLLATMKTYPGLSHALHMLLIYSWLSQ